MKWTKDKIFKEAKKYKYRSEWEKNSPKSYNAARFRKITNEVAAHMPLRKKYIHQAHKWTKENIKKEVLKYSTFKEWINAKGNSYGAAIKLNIKDEVSKHMLKTKWDRKVDIFNDAKNFKSKYSWSKNSPGAYAAAKKIGKFFFNEATKHMSNPNIKWTKKTIILDALKYKTRKEWVFNSGGSAEQAAQKLGILNEVSKHFELVGSSHKRCVYTIQVKNKKIIYIGLTLRFNKRISDHLKSKRFIKIIDKYGKNFLIIKKLTDYIEINKAQRLEIKLINKFKVLGYKVLNEAKGGGLGGNIVKWTREAVLKEAKKYSSINDWRKNSGGSYNAAHRNNYTRDATGHMNRKRKWKFASKKDILDDAKKYSNRREWSSKSGAYNTAKKMGIFDQAVAHMEVKKRSKWTKIEIINDAKKYKTKVEWLNNSPSAYESSLKNKFHNEATVHMKPLKKKN